MKTEKEIKREIDTLKNTLFEYGAEIDSLLKMRRLLQEIDTVILGVMRNDDLLPQPIRLDMCRRYKDPLDILVKYIETVQDKENKTAEKLRSLGYEVKIIKESE